MCPACMSSAALAVAGLVSTGGLTALAAKLLRARNREERISTEEPKQKEK
jgi:hypothetical protein